MVILTISVNAHSNKRNELLSALRLFTEVTRQEKGCSGCQVFQNINDECFINLEETWEHRSNLDAHICSDVFSALLGAIELLGKRHKIRINDDIAENGIAIVEQAKRRQHVPNRS